MTVPTYRIDRVCADLIQRMEGARPTWQGDPGAASGGFSRIAAEHLDTLVAEHDLMLATPGWGPLLRREVMETFLPRYTRLALEQNQAEALAHRSWSGGDPVARVVTTLLALFGAGMVYRVSHHPLSLGLFLLVAAVPFLPEIRRAWSRRRYRLLLQEVVDDMARIQDSFDKAPPRPAALGTATPESASVDPALRKAVVDAPREPQG